MIKKHGSAKWSGGLKDGQGTISTETGVLSDQAYGFATRFEGARGTNPEELIGAAHAACFSMQMSANLGKAGMTADSIETTSTVTLDPGQGAITQVHVDVVARVSGIDDAKFQEVAEATKTGCPVSKVLAGADITMSARLA